MNKINYFSILGFTALYVVTVFATAFLGYLHPFCWVGFPALAALLGAYSYYHVALRWPKFGAGTLLGLVFGLFLLVTGEGDFLTLGIYCCYGIYGLSWHTFGCKMHQIKMICKKNHCF